MKKEFEMFEAVLSEDEDKIINLIANGAKIDERDKGGSTPLIVAIECDKKKIASLLLDLGADPFLKNKRGESAYKLAFLKAVNDGDRTYFEMIRLHLSSILKW